MHKLNINELIEFKDEKFTAKILDNKPGTHIMLLCLRVGQVIPSLVTITNTSATMREGSQPTANANRTDANLQSAYNSLP